MGTLIQPLTYYTTELIFTLANSAHSTTCIFGNPEWYHTFNLTTMYLHSIARIQMPDEHAFTYIHNIQEEHSTVIRIGIKVVYDIR